jgi:hypothetical protein
LRVNETPDAFVDREDSASRVEEVLSELRRLTQLEPVGQEPLEEKLLYLTNAKLGATA